MKCVFADEQLNHYPESFLVNGVRQPNPEKPERVSYLKNALIKDGHSIERPNDYGLDHIRAIHDERYLTFLENAYVRWARIPGASKDITPKIHPVSRTDGYPKSVVAQAGFHMTDASAPISADTWDSALWSAWSAIHASEMILNGETSRLRAMPPTRSSRQCRYGGWFLLPKQHRHRHWELT